MRFSDDWVLYILFLLPLVIFIYFYDERVRTKVLSLWGSPHIVSRLTDSVSYNKRRWRKALEIFAFLLMVTALARPLWGKKQEEVKRRGMELVIAVDTSLSMLAQDYIPNRLEKAKQELIGLLNKLEGNRIGLVAFAGTAVTLCPLTPDTGALKIYLDILDTQIVGVQGTAVGDAIRKCLTLFEKGKSFGRLIVLLTDGEDHETHPLEAAQEAAKMGVKVYAIGIGAEKGEPIPLLDESGQVIGHKRDEKGEIILTRVDESTLTEIANATGGKYFRATVSESEIQKIFNEIDKLEKGELGEATLVQYNEKFQIPLLFSLILLIIADMLGERKGLISQIKNKWLMRRAS